MNGSGAYIGGDWYADQELHVLAGEVDDVMRARLTERGYAALRCFVDGATLVESGAESAPTGNKMSKASVSAFRAQQLREGAIRAARAVMRGLHPNSARPCGSGILR